MTGSSFSQHFLLLSSYFSHKSVGFKSPVIAACAKCNLPNEFDQFRSSVDRNEVTYDSIVIDGTLLPVELELMRVDTQRQ